VSILWGDFNNPIEATVNQETGEISASHAYQWRKVFTVTITATTDQGDTATAQISALIF